MQLTYYKEKTAAELPETIFEQDFNEDLVHQLVNTVISNNHSGTKAQKNRSDVSGGGKKPWRQKGTGRARAGTTRGPIWRSGGVTFAARPQLTKKKINKKMFKNGIKSILSKLAKEERIIMVKDFSLDEPKTKKFLELISPFETSSMTIILDDISENLHLASRNLKNIDITTADQINPVDLISHEKILLTDKSLEKIIGAYS